MAWVKVDDQFFFKPRARQAGKDGRALFWAGLCYCAANRTDGQIVHGALPFVAAMAEVEQDIAHLLVDVGLWAKDNEGYEVIDYLKFNPSRAQLDAEREAATERQQRSRSRRASQRDTTSDPAVTSADPSPSPDPDTSSSSSSTVTEGVPPEIWTTIADQKLQAARDKGIAVANPSAWRRKVIENDRAELGAKALEVWNGWDITPSQLVSYLNGSTRILNTLRRKETA